MTGEIMAKGRSGFGKGLIIGGLIGAVLALLYAPKSGQELRKDIRKKADDLKDGAGRYMRRLKKDGRLLLVRTRERADAARDAVTESAERLTGGKKRG